MVFEIIVGFEYADNSGFVPLLNVPILLYHGLCA